MDVSNGEIRPKSMEDVACFTGLPVGEPCRLGVDDSIIQF
jgi:hypothetical protein